MSRTATRVGGAALLALPLTFLAVAYGWPVAAILGRGLRPEGRIAFDALTDVVRDPVTWRIVRFTAGQAAASTLATLAVGLPSAALFARYEFRGRRLLHAGLMVPFVLPTIVVGAAFVALLARLAPVVDLRGSVAAIVLAHVFFNHAVVVRTVGGLWANLDPAEEEAARTLGASPLRAFLSVTLPRLRPAIAAASVIVALFSFTSFGVVLLLGGAARATIEVEIHRATTQALDLTTAAALAVLQLGAVVAALAVYGRLQRGRATTALAAGERLRRPVRTAGDRALLAAGLTTAMLSALPIAALVSRSLTTPEGFGLENFRALVAPTTDTVLAVAPRVALVNSLTAATAATLIAVAVGLAGAVAATGGSRTARVLDRALMLPLGTSSVTVGFGFLVAFGGRVTRDTAPLLVPVAQALIAVPFVVRTTLPVLRAIDERLREAAATLGAAPGRVRREVDLPIVARATLVAAGFAFAVALGEFGATVFLARAVDPTVPTAIVRLLGRPGAANAGQAMALSVVLGAVTGAVVLLIDRLRLGSIGSF